MSWTVVGLGNPGKEYEYTRHNVGRRAVEHFAAQYTGDVTVITPTTYMNHSGSAVKDVQPEHLIVVHDDLDLSLGEIRVSYDRGSGGHNGVSSIIDTLHTNAFIRVRIGISQKNIFGKIRKPRVTEKFVLEPFTKKEEAHLSDVFSKTDKALTLILTEGKEVAMNRCN